MERLNFKFSSSSTEFYAGDKFSRLKKIVDRENTVLITDEHIFKLHQDKFKGWNCIVLKPGEEYKVQETVDAVIRQLIGMEADRKTILIGVGGGVVTDITGYVASVYMRGLKFGFVPTTLLAMVDASIGGKNGVDVGVYKNLVGTIRQPSFIFHDLDFLRTLPQREWQNGFAEIIKHACIKDRAMFRKLERCSVDHLRKNRKELADLVLRNFILKTKVVKNDEFERGERRLLNFGHTLGHALENQYELSHGQAISIGMTYACHFSEKITGFSETRRVIKALQQYGLPTYASFNKKKVIRILMMDKKRVKKEMNYVLLENIGKGTVRPVSLSKVQKLIEAIQ